MMLKMLTMIFSGDYITCILCNCRTVSAASCTEHSDCVTLWLCALWRDNALTAASAAVLNQRRARPTIVFDTLWRNRPRPYPRVPSPSPPFHPATLHPDHVPLCGRGPGRASRGTRPRLSAAISLYFPDDIITDFLCSNYFLFQICKRVGNTLHGNAAQFADFVIVRGVTPASLARMLRGHVSATVVHSISLTVRLKC